MTFLRSDSVNFGSVSKSGEFSDQIQYVFLGESKCIESDVEKILGFVPFGAILTHFRPRCGHSD